ncbi:MAG: ATP-binding cassette domain-containing protein, partial [Anoxybacillus gonensis]|nr:ATP-binding cassette domain-containing protein [Anoxybacillus gonensis]
TMEMVGLQPTAKQKVKHYSLGMKQKLAIAQAIMEDQQILILDEPFNALDAESVNRIRKLLLDFKNEGRTILLTSHNQEDIDILCDYVFRINSYKLEPIVSVRS